MLGEKLKFPLKIIFQTARFTKLLSERYSQQNSVNRSRKNVLESLIFPKCFEGGFSFLVYCLHLWTGSVIASQNVDWFGRGLRKFLLRISGPNDKPSVQASLIDLFVLSCRTSARFPVVMWLVPVTSRVLPRRNKCQERRHPFFSPKLPENFVKLWSWASDACRNPDPLAFESGASKKLRFAFAEHQIYLLPPFPNRRKPFGLQMNAKVHVQISWRTFSKSALKKLLLFSAKKINFTQGKLDTLTKVTQKSAAKGIIDSCPWSGPTVQPILGPNGEPNELKANLARWIQ